MDQTTRRYQDLISEVCADRLGLQTDPRPDGDVLIEVKGLFLRVVNTAGAGTPQYLCLRTHYPTRLSEHAALRMINSVNQKMWMTKTVLSDGDLYVVVEALLTHAGVLPSAEQVLQVLPGAIRATFATISEIVEETVLLGILAADDAADNPA